MKYLSRFFSRYQWQRYQWFFLFAIVILVYVNLRISLATHPDILKRWEELMTFTAERPYGLRILIPLLLWPWQQGLHLSTASLFFVAETISMGLLIWILYQLFQHWLSQRDAALFSMLFIFLLPFVFFLHYIIPWFNPYDTPSMMFIAASVLLLWRGHWWWVTLLIFVATLNRESAIFIPFIAWALHSRRDTADKIVLPIVVMIFVFILTKAAVTFALVDRVTGVTFQFHYGDGTLRFIRNMKWLFNPARFLQFVGQVGLLPLCWCVLENYIPVELRRLKFVAVFYFLGLLLIGNIYEPRIFGDILVLLYIPVMIGLYRYLQGATPLPKHIEAGACVS